MKIKTTLTSLVRTTIFLPKKLESLSGRKLLLILSLLIILLGPLSFLSKKSKEATAAWWNDGWMYRKKVEVKENSGTNINNYPVKVALSNLGSNIQSDCDDIRVTDIHGKIIPSQVETCDPSGETIVWFQTDLQANQSKTFYVYYGNPSAGKLSYDPLDPQLYAEVNPTTTHSFRIKNSYIDLRGDNDNTSGAIRNLIHVPTNKDAAQEEGGSNYRVDYHYEATAGDARGDPGSAQILQDGPVFKEIYWTESTSYFTVYRKALLFANYPVLYQRWQIKNTWGESHTFNSNHHPMTESGRCYYFGGNIRCSADDGDSAGGISGEYGWFMDNANSIGMCKISSDDTGVGGTWRSIGYPRTTLTLNDQQTSGWYEYYLLPITSESQCSTYYNIQKNNKPSITLGPEEKAPGPVAYWKFDEGYGTTAHDSTRNNNNLTLSSAKWVEGIVNKALDNTTTGAYAQIAQNSSLNPTSPNLTISAWVLVHEYVDPGTNYWQTIVEGSGNLNQSTGYYLGFVGTGSNFTFKVGNGSTWAYVNISETNIPLHQWVHVVGVLDDSTIKIYVNGKLVGSNNHSISSIAYGSYPIAVGTLSYGLGSHRLRGFIDELKIYPYARSAAQIKQDYLAGKAKVGSVHGLSAALGSPDSGINLSDGLVGYWKMDESSWTNDCSTSTVIDSSGNGNDGKACPASTGPIGGAAGKFGNAGSFDGSNDYIKIENFDLHDSEYNDSTVAVWFKENSSGRAMIWSVDNGGYDKTLELDRNNSNQICAFRGSYGAGCITYDTNGKWTHAVVVYHSDNTLDLYINGELKVQRATTNFGGSQGYLSFGNNGETGEQFDGSIDEIRIYNRALSPREVRALYEWAPGPVVYYTFDEGTGTSSVQDTSGHGYTGTMYNFSNSSWVHGKYGKGLKFNGTNNRVLLDSPQTHYSNISICFWHYTYQTPDNYDSYVGARTAASNSNIIMYYPDGKYRIYLDNDSTSETSYASNSDVAINQWVHVCHTYDSSDYSRFYINGVLDKVGPNRGTLYFGDKIAVGQDYNTGRYIPAIIDDFRLYNYTLTPKQVIEIMNAGHPAVGSPVGSPVAYYKFDEGYGSTANNSGNGGSSLNGTLGTGSSAPSWTNDGKFGKALSFDGDNDYVELPSDIGILSGDFTIEGILKTTANSTTLISKSDTSYTESVYPQIWMMEVYNSKLRFGWRLTNGGGWTSVSGNTSVNDGVLHHWVVKRETSMLYLYLDGELDGSGSVTTSDLGNFTAFTYLGRFWNGSQGWLRYYSGVLDEVKIYNYALTEDEIRQEYNQGKALVMGAVSTDSSGNPSFSSSREYCIPGDTSTCNPPVLELKFDEKTGTTAYDTSGNGNDGTLTNMEASDWKSAGECHSGSCLEFDGSSGNDFIEISDSDSLDIDNSFTWTMWIYLNTRGSDDTVFGKYGAYEFTIRSSDLKIVTWGDDWFPSYTVPTGEWLHIAVTGNSAGNERNLYVNGKLEATSTSSYTTNISSYRLTIGKFVDTDGNGIDGKIDQLRIYDEELSPAQIAWDYNRGKPVGWWKFDECQGTTAYDSSGNGNNGTITIGGSGSQTSAGTCTSSGAWYNGATGKYNSSLNFDGEDDYVSVANDANLNFGTGDFSAAVWIKADGTTNDRVVNKWDNSITTGWLFDINETTGGANQPGYVRFRMKDGTNNFDYSADGSVDDSNWHHIAFVLDRDSSTGFKLYVDGKQIGSSQNPTAVTGSVSNNTSFGIGVIPALTGSYFNGQIDDVRIYNYALTPAQVRQLYNEGAAVRFGPAAGSP